MIGGQSREARSHDGAGSRVGIGPGRVSRADRAGMNPADATARTTPLAPRLVDEVRDLHDRNVALSRDAGGPRGRRGRRERREARDAENDLLRVLGFPSYDAFLAYVDPPKPAPGAGAPAAAAGVTLSLVDELPESVSGSAAALDAEETEAALLRVLRGELRGPDPTPTEDDDPADGELLRRPAPGGLADLHARIAYFEEELAETRFELGRVRDRRQEVADPAEPEPVEAMPAAAEALVHVAAEVRSLCELLRTERAELMSLGANARAQAEQILEAARREAQQLRDEAAAEARAVLDQASADAIALTRNAISTVDGLRRLAGEEQGRTDDAS